MSPKVSVIVPNYNHARYLPQRLESVLSQSWSAFELIVLDESDSAVRIGYVSGEDPNCESGACVLPPAELQTMMSEWLARRAPGTTVVVQPAAMPEA